MATFTPNYGLHQWEPEDSFLRTDFNEDLEAIDAALAEVAGTAAGKCRAVVGSYTGTGTYQEFDVGAPVTAVLVIDDFYTVCATRMSGTNNMLTVNGNGFYILGDATVNINRVGGRYDYIVLLK